MLVVVQSAVNFDGQVKFILALLLQVFNVLVALPGRPYEIGVLKVFGGCLSPPIALFDYILDNLIIVSWANVVLLSDLKQFLFFIEPFFLFDELLLQFLPIVFRHRLELLLVSAEDLLLYELVKLLLKLCRLFLDPVMLCLGRVALLVLLLFLGFLLFFCEAILGVVEIRTSFAHTGLVCAPSFVGDIATLAGLAALLERVCVGHGAVDQASFAITFAVLEQIGVDLLMRAVQPCTVRLAVVSVGAARWTRPAIYTHILRILLFPANDATTVHPLLLVQLGVDEVEDLVRVVDAVEQL